MLSNHFQKKSKREYLASGALIFALLATTAPQALAQDQAAEADAAEDAEPGDVIVVTARGFRENIQNIPESITLLSEQKLEDAGVDGLQGIADLTPNVLLNDSFRKGTIRLNVRGFGTPQAGEAPVSFVIDGATVQDVEFINQGIFDVDRVQVLRGPQGAIYGQGALAGAILIDTKKPTNDLSGFFGVQYETGDDLRVSSAISGPIIEDVLLFRVGGFYNDRRGQIPNVEGEYVDFVDDAIGVRGMLQFIPTDNLEFTATATHYDGEYGYGIQYAIPQSEINNEASYETASLNYPGVEPQSSTDLTFQVDWDMGFANLEMITNYAEIDDTIWLERDATPTPDTLQLAVNNVDGWSQEIRLTSDDSGAFRWAVGGSYRDRTRDYIFGLQPDDGNDSRPYFADDLSDARDIVETKSKDFGVFAFVGYQLTDRLEVSGALRYDENRRIVDAFYQPDVVVEDERTFSKLQPKLGLTFEATDNITVYANYSRGYRPGGFNHPNYALAPDSFESEISDSFEIGAKTTWLDDRLTLNGSFFKNDVQNYQTTVFATTIGNANLFDTPISGFELEANFRPTRRLTFDASYGRTWADIDAFSGLGDARDLANSDTKVPFTPSYTANASVTYDAPITDEINLRTYLAYRGRGEVYFRPDNLGRVGSADYFDARMTLEFGSGFDLAFYVDNLTNYREAVHLFLSGGNFVVTPNQPRSFGVAGKVKF